MVWICAIFTHCACAQAWKATIFVITGKIVSTPTVFLLQCQAFFVTYTMKLVCCSSSISCYYSAFFSKNLEKRLMRWGKIRAWNSVVPALFFPSLVCVQETFFLLDFLTQNVNQNPVKNLIMSLNGLRIKKVRSPQMHFLRTGSRSICLITVQNSRLIFPK